MRNRVCSPSSTGVPGRSVHPDRAAVTAMDQPVAVEDAVRVCRRLPLGDQSVEDAVDLGDRRLIGNVCV